MDKKKKKELERKILKKIEARWSMSGGIFRGRKMINEKKNPKVRYIMIKQ